MPPVEYELIDGRLMCRYGSDEKWTPADGQFAVAANALSTLTDDQRVMLTSFFCTSCGAMDPRCRCWDDE